MPRRTGNKYGNRPVTVDGLRFDSEKEYARWCELRILEKAGKIRSLERQKKFVLEEGFRDMHGRWQRPTCYICDFYYFDEEKDIWVIEDVKSAATANKDVYRLKKKMMLRRGLEITEV